MVMRKWMINGDNASAVLTALLSKQYTEVIYIEGRNCDTINNFYIEFQKKFRFPNYFNWNLDSFEECVADSDSYSPPVLCIINHVERIMESNEETQELLYTVIDDIVRDSETYCHSVDIIGFI